MNNVILIHYTILLLLIYSISLLSTNTFVNNLIFTFLYNLYTPKIKGKLQCASNFNEI